MGGTPIIHIVLEYLIDHANQVVTIGQISKDLQLETGKVRDAIANYIRRSPENASKAIEVITRGSIWRYNTAATVDSKDLFEKIRDLNDGKVLQQDTDGNLWVAQKVKI